VTNFANVFYCIFAVSLSYCKFIKPAFGVATFYRRLQRFLLEHLLQFSNNVSIDDYVDEICFVKLHCF